MNRQEKLEFLIEMITKANPAAENITEDTVLADLGLDSLDIVEIQLDYEDRTGNVTDEATAPVITVRDIINLMN